MSKRTPRRRAAGWMHVMLILLALISLLPIYLVALNSFKSHVEIMIDPLALPTRLDFTNYFNAWVYADFFTGYRNSILLSASAIVIVLVLSALGGYALAACRSRVTTAITLYFLIATTVPIQLFLFPLYFLMSALNLVGTPIPTSFIIAARNLPLALFLMRSFYVNVPHELDEAARIDGATTLQVIWRVMLPLVRPGLITVGVIVGLNSWNEFLLTSTFLQGQENFTATLLLRSMSGQSGSDTGLMMAGAMILILPILIAFVAAQKYFIDGLVSGAVKG